VSSAGEASADLYERKTCRLCNGARLERVVELTPTPPGNNFLRADELDLPEPVYPIVVNFCADCFHVQLGHVVKPSILFRSNYSYVSATSSVFVEHLANYARTVVGRFGLGRDALVADIGSNDGTCLRFFQQAGMRVIGVDPAKELAERATAAGVPTRAEFFDLACAKRLREELGPAAFITSHNACAHIDDLSGVLEGVRHWLADDGVFGVEVGYLLDVFENVWFDTIYHEHVDFHSVGPFKQFFARHGLELVAASREAPQGGSIRLFAQRAGGKLVSDGSAERLISLERERGLYDANSFKSFGARIDRVKRDLSAIVRRLKEQGKTIAGFGAPTKSTTLLTHFELGRGILDFIVDDNPIKQGLYSPLFHIPILPAQAIYEKKPDYLVLLAWNFAEPIMKAHQRYREQGGRFILPMPEARIVD
jgi:SAM-dependent methyltransferase